MTRKWITELVSIEETSTQVQVVFMDALELEGLLELVEARQDTVPADAFPLDAAGRRTGSHSNHGPCLERSAYSSTSNARVDVRRPTGWMRLLTYLPQLAAIGGVEMHVLQLTRELARRGFRVDLRYTTDGELHGEFGSFCESVVEGPSIRYGGSPWDDLRRIAPGVWSAMRTRPDVLYVNNFSELGWAAGVKALARAPIVCYLHEVTPFRSASISVLGKQVRQFVVASEFMRRTWTQYGLDPERVETIPNGIDLSDYPKGTEDDRVRSRQTLGLPRDAFVALYLGRIETEKGVEVLLDAWRYLDASPEEARLLLVGSAVRSADPAAYLGQLQDRAPAGCEWLPMRPDVLGVMHAADVLVLPSLGDEAFGRVLIEGMATGRPVVGSDSGGIPEILDGPFAEFLFPRGDAATLAGRLRALSRWRDERPELAEQCIRHVALRYTLQQTADRTEAVLRRAATGAPTSRP